MSTAATLTQLNQTVGFIKSTLAVFNVPGYVLAEPELLFLGQAVLASGLAPVLSGPGPLTLFAPNTQAFLNIFPTVQSLLANPAELARVLSYHVVPGLIRSTDLFPGAVPTLAGIFLGVSFDFFGNVFINNARVILPDLQVQNGIIHIIDQVLVPPF